MHLKGIKHFAYTDNGRSGSSEMSFLIKAQGWYFRSEFCIDNCLYC